MKGTVIMRTRGSNFLIFVIFLFYFSVVQMVYAQSPYPSSPVIQGIQWDSPSTVVRKALGSDNFSITWAGDDHQYTAWGDGSGFAQGDPVNLGDSGLGVARIEGPPASFTGIDRWGVSRGFTGGKSYGIIAIEGTLYMWVGPGSWYTSHQQTWLQWSTNNGATWQNSATFFTDTNEGIGLPTFLQFGKDNAGARDNFIYSYATDVSLGPNGPFTKIHLMRVQKSQILNRSSYEFYTGLDEQGSPIWNTNANNKVAVFSDPGHGVFLPSAMYNSALNRYILVVTHNDGSPSGWIGENINSGGLGIFDAPEPWGPWTTVEYDDNFLGSTTLFFAAVSTKQPDWLSADGTRFTLIFTGFGAIAQDAYQHIRGTFTLSGGVDVTPPDPPSNVRVKVLEP